MPAILAFIAHPDDESYSFGGTLALAARKGWRCLVQCATHGEQGERHDGGPPGASALAETREAELIASCEVLRIDSPEFWGLPDGGLHLHRGEERRIHRLIAKNQPDLLLTLGADGAYGHPDHVAVHRWVQNAWQAIDASAPPLLFAAFPPGLFRPQYAKCVASGIMGDPPSLSSESLGDAAPNYEVDITPRAKAKLQAMACHRSQLPGGDPLAMFPPGIVEELLQREPFQDALGSAQPRVRELLDDLAR